MNEIMTTTDKTPIEVALQVDEHGMTTAKKLYAFLELNPAHYSRWCKINILGNTYATEEVDYMRLTINGETPTGGIVARKDYKLTASFAKKLAMDAHCPKGEQAKDYFIAVEGKLAQVAAVIKSEHFSNFNNITFMKAVVAELEAQKNSVVDIKSQVANLDERITKIEEQKPIEVVAVTNATEKSTVYTRNNVYSSTCIAKAFGMGGKTLNDLLAAEGVIRKVLVYYAKRGKVESCWIVTDKYRPLKYSAQKYAGIKNRGDADPVEITYAWIPRGVAFIVNLLKYKGYIQQGDINNRTKARTHKKAAQ